MIMVTRRNGSTFALNPDLLERAEATPDTVLTLLGGTKYVVEESVEQVIERVRSYRAGILVSAELLETAPPARPVRLRPVSSREG